jgi:hypothetical protein
MVRKERKAGRLDSTVESAASPKRTSSITSRTWATCTAAISSKTARTEARSCSVERPSPGPRAGAALAGAALRPLGVGRAGAGAAGVAAATGGAAGAAAGGAAVAAGGADVVAAGGATVVAAGGATVVAAGGADVVAASGATVVAAGGADVVAGELGGADGAGDDAIGDDAFAAAAAFAARGGTARIVWRGGGCAMTRGVGSGGTRSDAAALAALAATAGARGAAPAGAGAAGRRVASLARSPAPAVAVAGDATLLASLWARRSADVSWALVPFFAALVAASPGAGSSCGGASLASDGSRES